MTKVTMPEPAAHIYPSTLKEFESAECVGEAFSIAVGNVDTGEHSVPLITTTQAQAYADARVREMQQWKPIETAPKDGTDIMLTDGEYVTVGHWYHEEPS